MACWPYPIGKGALPLRPGGERFSALTGTVFANAKLPLLKVMRVVEVMCHDASLRLVEAVCEVSHSTAFLWRHKVSEGSLQES